MKKILICFLLSTFSFSLCHAQDTFALKNRQEMATPAKIRNRDKTRAKIEPYILAAAGASNPWTFSGYGANSYYSSYDGYGYSGYASKGKLNTSNFMDIEPESHDEMSII